MIGPDVPCAKCRHLARAPFRELSREMLGDLDCAKTIHRYERGHIIYYAGTPVLAVYCIVAGTVKLTRSTEGGHNMVLRLLGPGRHLGFRSVFSNEPSKLTAEVVEPSLVCIIPRPAVENLLRRSPEFSRAMLKETARELTTSEEMLLDVTYLPAQTRVARLLMGMADGNHGEGVIGAALSRQDMAAAVRLTPQTFSRVLREMTLQGVIDSNRHRIIIRDPKRLHHAARRMR